MLICFILEDKNNNNKEKMANQMKVWTTFRLDTESKRQKAKIFNGKRKCVSLELLIPGVVGFVKK